MGKNKISKNLAQVIDLTGLIDYQEGSVVSREIINKTNGSITIFAFDDSQGLSEHTAPYDTVIYILDGVAEIKLSNKNHKIKKGEIIIMPAGEPHSVKASGKFKMLLTMIKS